MEPEVGEAAAVFHDRGHLEFGCVVHHAAQFGVVDGGGIAVGAGCIHQHQHGAFPRARRG